MPPRMTKKNKKIKGQKDTKRKNKRTKKFRGGTFRRMIGLGPTRKQKYDEKMQTFALNGTASKLKYRKSQLELEEKTLDEDIKLLEDKKEEFEKSKKQEMGNPFYQKAMVEIAIDTLRDKFNNFLAKIKDIETPKRSFEYHKSTFEIYGHPASSSPLADAYAQVLRLIKEGDEIPRLLSEIDKMMKSTSNGQMTRRDESNNSQKNGHEVVIDPGSPEVRDNGPLAGPEVSHEGPLDGQKVRHKDPLGISI